MKTLSRDHIVKRSDMAYAHISRQQTLDIYTPRDVVAVLPVLVHIHGGAWAYGDKKMAEDHGLFYAKHGFITVCINYRLSAPDSPQVKHPDHIEDCAAAVAWVFENIEQYGGDLSRVYLSGHSAGAHLATLLACDPRYLQKHRLSPEQLAGVVAVDSAAYNLNAFMLRSDEDLRKFPFFLEMKHRVMEIFGQDRHALLQVSPMHYCAGRTCKRFLVIVEKDRRLARDVSKNFVQSLQQAGKEAILVEVQGYGHEQVNIAMHEEGDPVSHAVLIFVNA